jgi:thioredoxin 1
MMRNLLYSIICLSIVISSTSFADIILGPYTFDDNAFPDAATLVSGGPPSLSFPTTGNIDDDLLLAAGPDLTKYIYGTPTTFYVDFLDNKVVNDNGADIVLFDLGRPDAAMIAVRIDSGSGWTEPQYFLLTDTGYDVAGYMLNAVEIDLDVFGVPAMDLIERIEINNDSIPGGGETISASIAAIGALNSKTTGSGGVQPGYFSPIAFAMIGLEGNVLSGTPNVSCTFNPYDWQYEIEIAGENYYWSDYVTVVTVSYSGTGIIAVNSSSDGKLIVTIYTINGMKAKADFQFVTYKSPPPPPPPVEQNVIELTEATFDQTVLNSDIPVFVDFWAPWCGPCLTMAPVVEEIADQYAGKVKFCKLNVDEAPNISMRYEVAFIPMFILFKDGLVQKSWVGVTDKDELVAGIEEVL